MQLFQIASTYRKKLIKVSSVERTLSMFVLPLDGGIWICVLIGGCVRLKIDVLGRPGMHGEAMKH